MADRQFQKLVDAMVALGGMEMGKEEYGVLFMSRGPNRHAASICNHLLAFMPLSAYRAARRVMETASALDGTMTKGRKKLVRLMRYDAVRIVLAEDVDDKLDAVVKDACDDRNDVMALVRTAKADAVLDAVAESQPANPLALASASFSVTGDKLVFHAVESDNDEEEDDYADFKVESSVWKSELEKFEEFVSKKAGMPSLKGD